MNCDFHGQRPIPHSNRIKLAVVIVEDIAVVAALEVRTTRRKHFMISVRHRSFLSLVEVESSFDPELMGRASSSREGFKAAGEAGRFQMSAGVKVRARYADARHTSMFVWGL
jgi:hypothetical protein